MDEHPENIRTLIASTDDKDSIFLLTNREMAKEIGDLSKQRHIIIAECASENLDNNTLLRRVSRHKFEEALSKKMGYSEMRAMQIVQHYGMSVTIFRRHYSTNPAIKNPKWATDSNADIVVAAALAGGWDSSNPQDRDFIEFISGRKYLEIEKKLSSVDKNDSPLEQWGNIWQVKSHFDILSVVCDKITPRMLEVFLHQVTIILRQRNNSKKLTMGIMNTLPILSVLFNRRQKIDLEKKIQGSVRAILGDNSLKLYVYDNLALLAEAAPEQFLIALKNDLDFFDEEGKKQYVCWALQVLAWDNKYVSHITDILLQMIERKNFGSGVLLSFFTPWLPQCGANIEMRNKMLDDIVKKHPNIGWEICISMLHQDTWVRNSMPRWQDLPPSTEMQITNKERWDATQAAFQHAVSMLNSVNRITKLMQTFDRLYVEQKMTLIQTVKSYQQDKKIPSNNVAEVQDEVRRLLSRCNAWISHEKSVALTKIRDELNDLYNSLSSDDAVQRHLWLFTSDWPDFANDHDMPIDERENFLKEKRQKAVAEILNDKNHKGLQELCTLIPESHSFLVGRALPEEWDENQRFKCALDFMPKSRSPENSSSFIRGIFFSKKEKDTDFVYNFIAQGKHKEWKPDMVLAFVLSDFLSTRKLWKIIDQDIPEIARDYWTTMFSFWEKNPDDLTYFVQKKVEYEQAKAAIYCAGFNSFAGMSGQQVITILEAMPNKKKESDFNGHYIEEAFLYIAQKDDVEEEKILDLEFQYYQYMGKVKPRAIFRKLAQDPHYFIQIITKHMPNDHKKWDHTWWNILDEWKIPPGTTKDEGFCSDTLKAWVSEARKLVASDADLLKTVDNQIGKILGHLPKSNDIPLPDVALEILNQEDANQIRDYFRMEVRNSRGVYCKSFGEGGDQERELAAKYRDIAQKLEEKGYGRVACTYRQIEESYMIDAKRDDIRAKTNTDW